MAGGTGIAGLLLGPTAAPQIPGSGQLRRGGPGRKPPGGSHQPDELIVGETAQADGPGVGHESSQAWSRQHAVSYTAGGEPATVAASASPWGRLRRLPAPSPDTPRTPALRTQTLRTRTLRTRTRRTRTRRTRTLRTRTRRTRTRRTRTRRLQARCFRAGRRQLQRLPF